MNSMNIQRDIINVIDSSLRIKAATTFASEYLKKQDAIESFGKNGIVSTNLNKYLKTKKIKITIGEINNYLTERQDLVDDLIYHIFGNMSEINVDRNYQPGSPGSEELQKACRNMTYYLYLDLIKDKIPHIGTNYFKIVLMVILFIIINVAFFKGIKGIKPIKPIKPIKTY